MKKVISNLLIFSFLLPVLSSCRQSGEINSLDKQAKSLIKSSHIEVAQMAQDSIAVRKELYQLNKKWPRLRALPQKEEYAEAEELHLINQNIVTADLIKHSDTLNQMVLQITDISAYKYHQANNIQGIVEAEVLLLNSLFSLREIANASTVKFLTIMNKFDQNYFDDLEINQKFKKFLFEEYTKTLAIAKITASDIEKTLSTLKHMREDNLLTKKQIDSISSLVKDRTSHEHDPHEEMNNFSKDSLTEKAQEVLSKAITDYHEEFKTLTFLYDPTQNDHPAIHALVIISNLTWGLPNTLVGLGFIITAAILAPTTHGLAKIVRWAGYEPYFMEMRLPRLKVAHSKMQIYADVCGLGYIPSKMSTGLFELDFCTTHKFASNHEAGHAKQSALLGPLYFPVAIISYALNMGHGGFIESWADAWEVKHD